MRVFISWSGQRSKNLAKALYDWLPLVLQNIQPYMSSEDIPSGSRWLASISSELQSCNFGILCLTPENLTSQWINFEAGAISKVVTNSHVVPLLYNLVPTDIGGPLDQFQANVFDEEGVLRVLRTINAADAERARKDTDLETAFTAFWPRLDKVLRNVEPNIKITKVDIGLAPAEMKLNYPLKCRVELENASTRPVEVSLLEYKPITVTHKQFIKDVLQIKFADWCPTPRWAQPCCGAAGAAISCVGRFGRHEIYRS